MDPSAKERGYVHTSSHDLESIFYVLIWICIYYSGPLDTRRDFDSETVALADGTMAKRSRPLTDKWLNEEPAKLAMWKSSQMNYFETILEEVHPYFADLKETLRRYHTALWNPAVLSATEVSCRVGSRVTHDEIVAILEAGLVEISEPSVNNMGQSTPNVSTP